MKKKLLITVLALTMFVGTASAISIPFLDSGNSHPPTSVSECEFRDDCTVPDNDTQITVEETKDVRLETEDSSGWFTYFSTLLDWQTSYDGDNYDDVDEGDEMEICGEAKVTWDSGSDGDFLYQQDGISGSYVLADNYDEDTKSDLGTEGMEEDETYQYEEFTTICNDVDTGDWYDNYPPGHKGWGFTLWTEIDYGSKIGETALNILPDEDGDGAIDEYDDCPQTEGDDDTSGCPDSDGDDVKDSEDQCTDTEGDEDTNGCPDSDNDGYIDSPYGADQCPDVSGSNSNGCPTVYYQNGDFCSSGNLGDLSSSTKTYDTKSSCQSELPDDNDDNNSDDDNNTDDDKEYCDDSTDNNGDGQVDEGCDDDDNENLFDSQETMGITLLFLAGFTMLMVYLNA